MSFSYKKVTFMALSLALERCFLLESYVRSTFIGVFLEENYFYSAKTAVYKTKIISMWLSFHV